MAHYNVNISNKLNENGNIDYKLNMTFDFDDFEFLNQMLNLALQYKEDSFTFTDILLEANYREIEEPYLADLPSIETAFNYYLLYIAEFQLLDVKISDPFNVKEIAFKLHIDKDE